MRSEGTWGRMPWASGCRFRMICVLSIGVSIFPNSCFLPHPPSVTSTSVTSHDRLHKLCSLLYRFPQPGFVKEVDEPRQTLGAWFGLQVCPSTMALTWIVLSSEWSELIIGVTVGTEPRQHTSANAP